MLSVAVLEMTLYILTLGQGQTLLTVAQNLTLLCTSLTLVSIQF
jgi:hypothetical protein